MSSPRLHWMRGRVDQGSGIARTLEWVGLDDTGEAIARVVRLKQPGLKEPDWRQVRAVALDADAKVIELRPTTPPDGAGWLACIGARVVGRAALPLQAVRTAEEALAGGGD